MIYGIGIDIIEVDRIKNLYHRQDKLVERVLSKNKHNCFQQFKSEARKIELLASRITVKEAFIKALGTVLGKMIALNEIDCFNDELGKPCINYEGFTVHVSISHTEHYAVSQVIIEK